VTGGQHRESRPLSRKVSGFVEESVIGAGIPTVCREKCRDSSRIGYLAEIPTLCREKCRDSPRIGYRGRNPDNLSGKVSGFAEDPLSGPESRQSVGKSVGIPRRSVIEAGIPTVCRKMSGFTEDWLQTSESRHFVGKDVGIGPRSAAAIGNPTPCREVSANYGRSTS
jgi:hypothetical protein